MTQGITALDRYLILYRLLTDRRRHPNWKPGQDRPLLSIMDDEYQLLSESEREEVEKYESSWPEVDHTLVDDASEMWVDSNLDAAEDGPVTTPPRVKAT